MQIILREPSQNSIEEDPISIEMTLVPASGSEGASNGSTASASNDDLVKSLYEAVSACTALHPDPVEEDAEEGADSIPGAGGWITADNAGDYFDEEGQFRGFGEVGQEAGSTRPREDHSTDQNGEYTDHNRIGDGGDEQQETKWRRLD